MTCVMDKVDVLTDFPKWKFVNMKSVDCLKISFNDFTLCVDKRST